MSKERFTFQWCLVCLVSFSVVMRILSQVYIMRNDLAVESSLSIVVKKIKTRR